MNILEVKNLKKIFGDEEVISDISFNVAENEVVAIIGPSGSGKSTILRCINRLETIDGGTINVCGEEMIIDYHNEKPIYNTPEILRKIRLNIGMVFQNFNLFPHMTVLQNITEAPKCVLKTPKEEAELQALILLEKMGLSDKANSYPCELSGGQQQRVSIARSMALNPKILFFDEPTSALDPELTGEILKVLKELAAEKNPMVIVTHEMAFARDVADRVIFMDKGVIIEEGPPDQVISNPKNERTKLFLKRYFEN